MAWTYERADKLLTGRYKQCRKLENNTYLQRRLALLGCGEDIAIQFHSTDIITYRPDGDIEITCGGWFDSPTTRQRVREYSPIEWLYNERIGNDTFRVVRLGGRTYEYNEPMVVKADGGVQLREWNRDSEKERRKEERARVRNEQRAAKQDAIRQFKQARLKPLIFTVLDSVVVSLPVNQMPVRGWGRDGIGVCGAGDGFALYHLQSGTRITFVNAASDVTRAFDGVVGLRDTITGYLVAERLGLSTSAMSNHLANTIIRVVAPPPRES